MKKRKPCRCDAYPFPHRELGGKCEGEPREDTEVADRWWARKFNGRPSQDERLDDPRHVPYSNLGRGR